MSTGASSKVRHHVNINRMSTCIMETDIMAFCFHLFGCHLGKANQIFIKLLKHIDKFCNNSQNKEIMKNLMIHIKIKYNKSILTQNLAF